MSYSILLFGLVFILLILLGGTVLFFRKIWILNSRIRHYTLNIFTTLYTVVFLCLIIEISFYFFVAQSDSFSFTLANQRWFEKYWSPINQFGYRDDTYSEQQLNEKKLIFVVGDSFVAGQGIRHYQDRFSSRLQVKLDSHWQVINLAQVGWSTSDQYQAIVAYPHKPAILILSYFVDDIRGIAKQHLSNSQFDFGELITPPPSSIRWLVNHSYFANFYYWQWYRYQNQQPEDVYWRKLRSFYENDEIWALHQQELKSIVDYTQQNNVVLFVIMFPNLISVEPSQPIIQRVHDYLETLGVDTLDLTSLFVHKKPDELIVNRMDAHPNEQVNLEVADVLFQEMNKRGFFSK